MLLLAPPLHSHVRTMVVICARTMEIAIGLRADVHATVRQPWASGRAQLVSVVSGASSASIVLSLALVHRVYRVMGMENATSRRSSAPVIMSIGVSRASTHALLHSKVSVAGMDVAFRRVVRALATPRLKSAFGAVTCARRASPVTLGLIAHRSVPLTVVSRAIMWLDAAMDLLERESVSALRSSADPLVSYNALCPWVVASVVAMEFVLSTRCALPQNAAAMQILMDSGANRVRFAW